MSVPAFSVYFVAVERDDARDANVKDPPIRFPSLYVQVHDDTIHFNLHNVHNDEDGRRATFVAKEFHSFFADGRRAEAWARRSDSVLIHPWRHAYRSGGFRSFVASVHSIGDNGCTFMSFLSSDDGHSAKLNVFVANVDRHGRTVGDGQIEQACAKNLTILPFQGQMLRSVAGVREVVKELRGVAERIGDVIITFDALANARMREEQRREARAKMLDID